MVYYDYRIDFYETGIIDKLLNTVDSCLFISRLITPTSDILFPPSEHHRNNTHNKICKTIQESLDIYSKVFLVYIVMADRIVLTEEYEQIRSDMNTNIP